MRALRAKHSQLVSRETGEVEKEEEEERTGADDEMSIG